MIAVVMGVSGSGKSTVGRQLAERLGIAFLEGDDLHPPASRARMEAGLPLDEQDRGPWLDALAAAMTSAEERGEGLILTCSALRRSHRDRLRAAARNLRFIHLAGARPVIAARLRARRGHFMPPELLDSQCATLEPPEGETNVLTLDVERPAAELAEKAARWLGNP